MAPLLKKAKARSSQNATTHGLNSKTVVLANESQEAYDQLLAAYREEWQPQGHSENDLVIEMANARWRLRRIWAMENAALDSEMFIQRADFEAAFSVVTPAMRQADAFLSLARHNAASLDCFHRYEVRYTRAYERAMKNLVFLQKQRGIDPVEQNEPDVAPEPEPIEPPPLTPGAPSWLIDLLLWLVRVLKPRRTPRRRPTPARNIGPLAAEPPANATDPETFHWESTYAKRTQ